MDTTLQNIEGVTITYAMMVIGVGVGLVVQLVKAVLDRFPWFTDDLRKPVFPLVGIGVAMTVFRLMGLNDWLLGGVLIGLSAGGGYSFTAGMLEKLGLKDRPILPVLLVGLLLLTTGCTDRWITQQEQLEFAMFNVRVQDWNEQCLADPNQCAQGLANMAAEMQQWSALIVGDPNSLGVTP